MQFRKIYQVMCKEHFFRVLQHKFLLKSTKNMNVCLIAKYTIFKDPLITNITLIKIEKEKKEFNGF